MVESVSVTYPLRFLLESLDWHRQPRSELEPACERVGATSIGPVQSGWIESNAAPQLTAEHHQPIDGGGASGAGEHRIEVEFLQALTRRRAQ